MVRARDGDDRRSRGVGHCPALGGRDEAVVLAQHDRRRHPGPGDRLGDREAVGQQGAHREVGVDPLADGGEVDRRGAQDHAADR